MTNQYKITVVNQNGSLVQAPATVPTVTSTTISDLSAYATISNMLANDATTYANAVNYVDGKFFVNTSQLSANLSNYQTTAGLSANVLTLTANAAGFLGNSSGTIANVASWITSNAAAAYSNSVSYVNSRSFVNTSQLSTDLASYQTISGLPFAVSLLEASNSVRLGGVTLATIDNRITSNASAAYTNAVSYVDGKSFVNTSQLSTNLTNYQTTGGLSANVATLTANNANNLGGVAAASYVNTAGAYTITGVHTHNANIVFGSSATIIANGGFGTTGQVLTSNGTGMYWSTATGSGAVNVAAQYTWTNTQTFSNTITFSQVIIGTANNANNLSGLPASSYVNTAQLSSNLSNYQTTGGLSTNVATLTANNSTNFGGLSLTTVQGQITGNAATAYTNAITIASNATNLTSGTVAEPRLPFRMDQNLRTTDNVNFGGLTVSGNLVVNGSYTVISGNSVAFTDNMLFLNNGVLANITNIVANGTHIVFTANNNYQVGWDALVTNVTPSSYNGLYLNITQSNATSFTVANTKTGSYVTGGNARGHTESNPDLGFAAAYNSGTYAHTGFFRDSTSGVWKVFDGYLPEPDTSIYIDQTNASFNIARFQASEVRLGNNTNYGVVNTTSFTGTANNSNNFGGLSLTTVQGQITGNAATAYANATTFASSATNITSGTLPNARLSSAIVNTSGSFTITGMQTFSNGITFSNTVTANGSNGSAGQVLTSSGASGNVYWSTLTSSGGTVTNIATGSGLTGGPITATGTVSVLANTGVIANATGVFVNSTYIATLTANNANNLGGVAAASYVNTSQLSSNLSNYQTTGGLSANVATLTSNNSTNFGGLSLTTVQGQITGNADTAYTNSVNYVTAQSFVNTSQLSANLSNYQTSLGLAANVATLNANNSTNFGGLSLTTVQGQITGNADTAYTNATTFASNASNITTGTLPNARLSSAVVNTSGAFTLSGINTFDANVVISNTGELVISANAGIFANGSLGSAGQVLTSNASSVYWSTASGGGDVTTSGVQTLTNKRIDPRVSSAASASSVTPDISSFDMYVYTALAAGLTINATTGGTPVNGNKLVFRFKDDGTARALSWTTSGSNSFRAIGVTLPTTTTISKVTYVGCIYNSNESFWDVVAVTTQA